MKNMDRFEKIEVAGMLSGTSSGSRPIQLQVYSAIIKTAV